MAKKISGKQVGMIGAGVAALAAGAGLAYYLSTNPKAVKKVKSAAKKVGKVAGKAGKEVGAVANKWAGLMHKELVVQMKKAKHLSRAEYAALVDKAAKKYVKLHKVSKSEMARLVKEMKTHWAILEREMRARK
jgi:hypothetical protein